MTFSKYNGSTVLITGGAGFIGSRLAKKLVDYGAKPIIIDNLHPQGGGNLYNIMSIIKKIHFLNKDIQSCVQNAIELSAIVGDCEYLFHLAGLTGHMDSMISPLIDLKQNVEATLNLLEFCREHHPKIRVIYTSTRQLYGSPTYLPVDEQHPVNPLDINGIHKLTSENYVNLYYKYHKIPTTILRLSNVYGPGLRVKDSKQMFLGAWLRSILEDKPFEIWGGEQKRDLIYVDDLCDAILLAALSSNTIGETYNIGGNESVSLNDLAKILTESARKKVLYHIKSYPQDRKPIEIGDIYLDSQKLKSAIAWSPNIDLRTGLSFTLNYYQQHLPGYL